MWMYAQLRQGLQTNVDVDVDVDVGKQRRVVTAEEERLSVSRRCQGLGYARSA
jgi:hypothetical protein